MILPGAGWLAGRSYRIGRRVVVAVVGSTVLLIGIALLVLPGPAFIVIPLGLAILAIEFAWARLWLQYVRDLAKNGLRRRSTADYTDSAD
jgi:tellurite resistance protein TerC